MGFLGLLPRVSAAHNSLIVSLQPYGIGPYGIVVFESLQYSSYVQSIAVW